MNDIALYENIPSLENSFPVKVLHISEEVTSLYPHWHEHLELIYVLDGKGEIVCNDNTYSVKRGSLITVNSNCLHFICETEFLEYICLIIHPKFFNDVSFGNVTLREEIADDLIIAECMDNIYSESCQLQKANDMMIKSYTYKLISHLIRNYHSSAPTSSDQTNNTKRLEMVKRIITYISEHYHEKISTSDLAKLCFLSESHFCRLFKLTFGISVMTYINQLRIEKACVLLKNTDNEISHIADALSFVDANYFARVFKKVKGISPSRFRKYK